MPRKFVSAEVKGLMQVTKKIRESGPKGVAAFAGALYVEGLHIMDDSVKRTPLVTSRLRNSHFVTVPRPTTRTDVRLGYGVKYAYAVHEGIRIKVRDLPRRAQMAFWAGVGDDGSWKTSSQGGPRFLRNAINATRSGRMQRIAATTARYFEAGIGVQQYPGMPKSEGAGRANSRRMSKGKREKV